MERCQLQPEWNPLRDSGRTYACVGRGGTPLPLDSLTLVSAVADRRILPCLPKVEWKRASVFDPRTYEADLASCDALVSTLGILLETDYKVQGQARPLSVLRAIAENATGSRGNPLARQTDRSYERINRDSGRWWLFPPRTKRKRELLTVPRQQPSRYTTRSTLRGLARGQKHRPSYTSRPKTFSDHSSRSGTSRRSEPPRRRSGNGATRTLQEGLSGPF